MTTYSDRVASIHSRLTDLARDFEAHLGLASRSHEWQPNFDRANYFPEHEYGDDAVEVARVANVNRFVKEYGDQADRAARALQAAEVPGVVLTGSDIAARDAALQLAASFHSVHDHDNAIALVATLN
ncbi:hypothetical protein [Agromyces sp. NPDC058104]|uniref:hypothetical protein n=1 Tax=Agromyces sp. NPDC058104 TaxID=3346342 RepID=UPI0036D98026